MSEIVYVNGEFRQKAEAVISVFDYGLAYGYGLFETMRVYSGRAFMMDEHVMRLLESAVKIRLDTPAKKEITSAIESTIKANKINEGYVKATVTYGVGEPRMNFNESKPTLIVYADTLPDFSKKYENGIRLKLSEVKRNAQSTSSKIKSLNYLDNIIARREAMNAGFDDALLLNTEGFVSEAASSNIFCVRGRALYTPRVEDGVLPGTTRGVVLESAGSVGLRAREKKISLKELLASEECFLTNAVMEVVPVTEISGRKIGGGKPGESTGKIHETYKKRVLEYTSNIN